MLVNVRHTTTRPSFLRRLWALGVRASPRNRYLFAIVAATSASAVRIVLNPYWGSSFPYIFYFPTTLFCALFGGLIPALIGVGITSLLTVTFILPPIGLLQASRVDLVGLLVYLGMDTLIAWMGAKHRELWLAAEDHRSTLQRSEQDLQRNLDDSTRLHRISTQLLHADDVSQLLDDILAAAIEMTRADMGNLQLLTNGVLEIAAHRGLDASFLEFFAAVHDGEAACGAALTSGGRVVVEDVTTSPIFAGTRARDVMLAAGALAVQSTPLVSRSGRIVGMFSTHYRRSPNRPSERELQLLDILARQAADVIERRQREEALRAKEAELEVVINDTPFLLTRCSRDLRYNFVSRAYAEMLQLRPDDIIGRPIVEITGPDAFDVIRPHVERVLQGNRVEYEADVPFKGVGIRSLQVIYTPDRDDRGRVVGWVASILDVTERRRADQARALLASIVDTSDDPIISFDLDGTITSWNAAAERTFGHAAADAIGRPIALILPAERLGEQQEILERLRAGESLERFETERLTRDGRRLPVAITASPLRNDAGVIIGASKIERDISDRVRADAERHRLLASEQAARARAEAANRAKDEFLATVSHELRTPLNAILGWASMLENRSFVDGRTVKGLSAIQRNARMLTQLVDDVLDVGRVISGRLHLDVAPMDLGDAVDGAVEAILPAATAKDIDVHVVLDPAARALTGDATRLRQVVWNLLSNAVKFTPAGGRVDVTTRSVDREIEIIVHDTGIGIDPVFLPFVFDRFRQADASTTRAHGGLGLGLAIVRHLVELHGGTVQAQSDGPNAGATFMVKLPVRQQTSDSGTPRTAAVRPSAAAPCAAASEMPSVDGVRVLVVDDDPESCDVMSEVLRAYGAIVRVAASASEAMDALSDFGPDVVMSDLAMPGRDGFALLADVRASDSAARRVPMAAITAYARHEDRDRAIAAGFDEYLAKPVDPAALVLVVAKLAAAVSR